ncbi:Tetratricopeptide repeat protein 4 [Porites harrisoni]
MARNPVTAAKEGDVTSVAEETPQFDDENLRAIAEVYKNEGNDEYKKKNFNNAIYFYTEGIKVSCKDEELNAKLYSNRAAAHFNLGNYTETLNDATIATGLQPSFLKAFVRGASACVQLKNFDEAITWCNKGLAIASNNQNLLEIRSRSVKEQRELQGSLGEKLSTMQYGTDRLDRGSLTLTS